MYNGDVIETNKHILAQLYIDFKVMAKAFPSNQYQMLGELSLFRVADQGS